MVRQKLGEYDNSWFERGKPIWVEAIWLVASLFVSSTIPGNQLRILLLRAFGADIGSGVIIKPRVRVKFPWRLVIGDDSWIGEAAWVDNLATVHIAGNCCVSQGVYICTGNHDWNTSSFELKVEPVTVKKGAWIGAFARIGPGVSVGENSVVAMGAILSEDAADGAIVAGNPATKIKQRS